MEETCNEISHKKIILQYWMEERLCQIEMIFI